MTEASLRAFTDSLTEIIPVLMKGFARHQVSEFYRSQITLPQFLVLNFLGSSSEYKMKDLAHFMKVTTAAMTGIVDRLVRNGYVRRLDDSRDRRIIRVELTLKGRELLHRVKEQRRRLVIRIFGKLSEKDRQDYLRILKQIRNVLAEEELP